MIRSGRGGTNLNACGRIPTSTCFSPVKTAWCRPATGMRLA